MATDMVWMLALAGTALTVVIWLSRSGRAVRPTNPRAKDHDLPPLDLRAFKTEPQVPIPPAPLTRPAVVPTTEPEDEAVDLAAVEAWIGQTIMIEYTDANGDDSRRRVTIRNVSTNAGGMTLLRCWCHERQDWRSFRLDRINAVIDLQTGEVFEDVEEFFEGEIAAPLQAAGSKAVAAPPPHIAAVNERPMRAPSPHAAARQALQPFLPEITTLVFLARADGKFRASEKIVVSDYVISRCPAVAPQRRWLEGYLGRMTPDRAAIDKMLGLLPLSDRDRMQQLLHSLAQLSAADGAIGDHEHNFIAQFSEAVEARMPPAP